MNNYVVDFDPVILSLGPVAIRWYGLMYVIGFIITNYLMKILSRRGFFKVKEEEIDQFMTLMLLCMFIGARVFYVFIYNWDYYSQHLAEVPAVWQGGLSFHGALTGLILGGLWMAKKYNLTWAQVMDVVALSGTQGLFFGRMGNFINGELYGRVTNSSFGMIFPSGGPYPRHPSQLYEGVMEGIILSLILWLVYPRLKSYGYLSSIFLFGYGFFRFIIEFFREPDAQLGYYFGFMTMGQILCTIMMMVGISAWLLTNKFKEHQKISI